MPRRAATSAGAPVADDARTRREGLCPWLIMFSVNEVSRGMWRGFGVPTKVPLP